MSEMQEKLRTAIKAPDYVRESLERIKQRIESNMSTKHRNASGESVRSLTITMNGAQGTLWGLRSFMAMETGRRAGHVPRNFVDILSKWIVDKGISIVDYRNSDAPLRQQIHSVAWYMAKSIRDNGTALSHMAREDIYSNVIEEEFEGLQKKLMISFGSDIDYVHKQYTRNDT